MKWRTDKPMADVIVAKIENEEYPIVLRLYDSEHYQNCSDDYIYNIRKIEKWADLKEDETVTKCHELEDEIDNYIGDHFSEAHDGVLLSDVSRMELAITDIAPMARHFANWGAEHRTIISKTTK